MFEDSAVSYVRETAPDDVRSTMDWLESEGWSTESARGGQAEPFGNAIVVFSKDLDRLIVTRDRSQWMLDIQRPDWKRSIDMAIMVHALAGRADWTPAPSEVSEQLPSGVSWRETLPRALDWLASTADAVALLRAMQQRRATTRFPRWFPPSDAAEGD
jgi:hypothetical protein